MDLFAINGIPEHLFTQNFKLTLHDYLIYVPFSLFDLEYIFITNKIEIKIENIFSCRE